MIIIIIITTIYTTFYTGLPTQQCLNYIRGELIPVPVDPVVVVAAAVPEAPMIAPTIQAPQPPVPVPVPVPDAPLAMEIQVIGEAAHPAESDPHESVYADQATVVVEPAPSHGNINPLPPALPATPQPTATPHFWQTLDNIIEGLQQRRVQARERRLASLSTTQRTHHNSNTHTTHVRIIYICEIY